MDKKISRATLERLPIYHRTLKELQERGEKIISSSTLAEILNATPEKIRKDLSDFGQFGMKGVGYNIEVLKRGIEKILGLRYRWALAVVGAGNLGKAIINDKNFSAMGFNVEVIFDVDEQLIGTKINGVKVYSFEKLDAVIKRKIIDIGVITVPVNAAQNVADALTGAGIKGIWNFAPTKISVPPDVTLVNEDFNIGLMTLTYNLAKS